ncbi:histidine kinase hhk13p [Neofusicoccum parvum]|uniref:Putative histidine kinase hhk13p protein n=1 Tax=Botryosphaeria parva (strain UCR-NP2) TaxID=1287680 RepID=R1E882_BOTPV|nr:putative histidine kinase hhk13p protein [Neofusicoccum parvum UCRNP2]GME36455.1 histidine kinase hhk13p [Neofusicoccum parvum]
MAEFSPAGLFIADSEGHIIYCNDTWYEISRVPKDTASTNRWIDAVKPEDQQLVVNLWSALVSKTEAVTAEFRFKTPWEDKNGNRTDTWVLFSAYPEKNAQGTLKSVFGTITNISQQKWAEGFQKRKMEEAVELKRQQENFIDITSHEMRNPLSAILQCADEISSSLYDFRQSGSKTIDEELVISSIDAAQTIALCAQHQKRIVDDVLTLSKLDSAMLLVTPVDVQPLTVVQRALKMFEGELQTADIQMEFVVDDSFSRLGVDWVRLDPSRVLQVLINLTTNAIKFTTTESRRTIKVTIAASKEKFSTLKNRLVNYFPTRSRRVDMTQSSDWGNGEEIYVGFAVQDTGRGLNEEEKKLLFLRFSQASPRTHVQYGGSGLGLFISRELTELQGGEIGVSSEAGKGSTFAFYVKARRSSPPEDPVEQLPVSLSRAPSDARNKARNQESLIKTKDFAAHAPSRPTSAASTASQRANTRKETVVLIVEDNLVNQKVLQKQLKNQGFTVHVANHGGECLEQLRHSTHASSPQASASPPLELSVVLMDQEMPVMDGLACTRTIREWEQKGRLVRHVPIIAVTANARAEQIAQLLAAGMDDVVSKPFRIPELVPKIEELAARFKNEDGKGR